MCKQTTAEIKPGEGNTKRLEQRQRTLGITPHHSTHLKVHGKYVLSHTSELHHDLPFRAFQLEVLYGGNRHPALEVHVVGAQLQSIP